MSTETWYIGQAVFCGVLALGTLVFWMFRGRHKCYVDQFVLLVPLSLTTTACFVNLSLAQHWISRNVARGVYLTFVATVLVVMVIVVVKIFIRERRPQN
jgi:hypothetical protein